ncbi:MAG: alpha/beta hydrolase [Spirochaetales bacterium]|nr:alpha/beta hydrolase [Spirochaetales bacterium]
MAKNKIYKSDSGREQIISYYSEILEHWPVEHDRYFINTQYGKTHVIDSGRGNGEAVFMIHGSSSNSATWMGDVRTWSSKYRTIAIDIPGEPGLSEENRIPLTGNDFAEWLDAIARNLGFKKISIIGMSLGGWCALKYATCFPEKLDKLVLIVPAGLARQRAGFVWKALFLAMTGDAGIDKIQKLIFGGVNVPTEALDFGNLVARHFNPITEPIPVFTDQELGKIKCPVQYFAGMKDPLLNTKKSAERLKKAIPDARINLFPERGHVIIDQGANIYQILRNGKDTNRG